MPASWRAILDAWRLGRPPTRLGLVLVSQLEQIREDAGLSWSEWKKLKKDGRFWEWVKSEMAWQNGELLAHIAIARRELLAIGLGEVECDRVRLNALLEWLREHDADFGTKPRRIEVTNDQEREQLDAIVGRLLRISNAQQGERPLVIDAVVERQTWSL